MWTTGLAEERALGSAASAVDPLPAAGDAARLASGMTCPHTGGGTRALAAGLLTQRPVSRPLAPPGAAGAVGVGATAGAGDGTGTTGAATGAAA